MELVCQVSHLSVLQTAVDNGAECIHLDYNGTCGTGFERALLRRGIRYAHDNGCTVALGFRMRSRSVDWKGWRDAIDGAARAGVDSFVLSDPAMLLYASANYPDVRLHACLSDYPASGAINISYKRYGVSRVVLPRVVSLSEVEHISRTTSVELELVGFGRQSAIIEGRRTTTAPGTSASAIGLGDTLQDISVGLSATAENAANENCYAGRHSPDISVLRLLPHLKNIGVRAIKIEAQDDSPARLVQVTRVWRDAIDACRQDPQHYAMKPAWITELCDLARQPGRRLS
jgi:putative protease